MLAVSNYTYGSKVRPVYGYAPFYIYEQNPDATSTAAFNLPALSLAATVWTNAVNPDVTLVGVLPALTFAATVTVTAPTYTVDAAFVLPALTFSANATDADFIIYSAALNLPALTFAATVAFTQPNAVTCTAAFVLPALSFAATVMLCPQGLADQGRLHILPTIFGKLKTRPTIAGVLRINPADFKTQDNC